MQNPHEHRDKNAAGRTPGDAAGSAGWNPQTRFAVDALKCKFPDVFGEKCGTYNSGGTSDHPGNAADCPPGAYATCYAEGTEAYDASWAAAKWLRKHADALGVSYVIWYNRIWSRANDAAGWRDYGYGACAAGDQATEAHYDHVHISMFPSLA